MNFTIENDPTKTRIVNVPLSQQDLINIQRQQSLRENTLEEFLIRAGVHQPQQQQQHDYCNGYVCGNVNETRGDFIENNISLVPAIGAYPVLDGLIKKNNGNSSSISPSPYVFSSSQTGRGQKRYDGIVMEKKCSEMLKRRKIKNRESAARSQARKEARVKELEDENERLKKENQELREKKAKGMIKLQGRPERQLRRTLSDIK